MKLQKSIALLLSIVGLLLSCTAVLARETITAPDITVEDLQPDKVTLSWEPVPGENVGYMLERSTPDYPNMFQRIDTVSANVYEATDYTVQPGRTYYYNVIPMGLEETYRIEVNTKKVTIPEEEPTTTTSKIDEEEGKEPTSTTITTTTSSPTTTSPPTTFPSHSPSAKTSVLVIGSTQMNTSSGVIELNVAPKIENGVTLVPLRAISEALGAEVIWEPSTKTIIIIQK